MNNQKTVRQFIAASILTAGLSFAMQAMANDALTINTKDGTVIGVKENGLNAWVGIPYAKPPVGKLRWQPPQPVQPWKSPRQTKSLSNQCAQNGNLGDFASAGGSEDCLYLNVYRSSGHDGSKSKLPVFVWIHGGALQVGQGGDYDPAKLATGGNAIVVTLNYRLGVFGFFAHPSIDGEGHNFANYGLLDQQAALSWVHKNIASFGGDPDNVTIAGESSGGNSVMAHIAAPGSAGLFQHAVAMSGGGIMARYPAFGAPRPLSVAESIGKDFAKETGCESNTAVCLRSLSTKQILDAQPSYVLNEFVVDGTVLPMHPSDAYKRGKINRVTLINGSTRDEGRFFVALPELMSGKSLPATSYPEWIKKQYGDELAAKVLEQYPLSNYENASEAFASAATDSMFSCPGLAMNKTLNDKMPVYAYEFSDRTAPSYVGATTFPLLAAHTFELSYVFPGFHGGGNKPAQLNQMQQKLSDQMIDYFTHAATLSEKKWSRFDSSKKNFMVFELPSPQIVIGKFSDTHKCEFWDQSGLY